MDISTCFTRNITTLNISFNIFHGHRRMNTGDCIHDIHLLRMRLTKRHWLLSLWPSIASIWKESCKNIRVAHWVFLKLQIRYWCDLTDSPYSLNPPPPPPHIYTRMPPGLSHWGQYKMAANISPKYLNAVSWMKMYELCWSFHWSLSLRFELTIFQHWFR